MKSRVDAEHSSTRNALATVCAVTQRDRDGYMFSGDLSVVGCPPQRAAHRELCCCGRQRRGDGAGIAIQEMALRRTVAVRDIKSATMLRAGCARRERVPS